MARMRGLGAWLAGLALLAAALLACGGEDAPSPPTCAPGTALAEDCAKLLAIKATLAGTASLNWSADIPVTAWDGVTVGGTPKRVTGLDLASRGLTGWVPPELGQLTGLTSLYLAGNRLRGCVPAELEGVPDNDSAMLLIVYCREPVDVSNGPYVLGEGAYQFALDSRARPFIFDVPPGIQIELTALAAAGEHRLLYMEEVTTRLEVCFQLDDAEECGRVGPSTVPDHLSELLDRIARSARLGERPQAAEAEPTPAPAAMPAPLTMAVCENVIALQEFARVRTDVVPEGGPCLVTVSDGSETELMLEWVGGPSNATKWQYRQRKGYTGPQEAWADIYGSGVETVRHRVEGLEADATYYFEVRAWVGDEPAVESNEARGSTARREYAGLPRMRLGQVSEGGRSWVLGGSIIVDIPIGFRVMHSFGALAGGTVMFTMSEIESMSAQVFDLETGKDAGRVIEDAGPASASELNALFDQILESARFVP